MADPLSEQRPPHSFEGDEGHDLNGDGDAADLVVRTVNTRTLAAPGVLAATAAGICTTTGRPCVDRRDCVGWRPLLHATGRLSPAAHPAV
jgi:hypothetical protein